MHLSEHFAARTQFGRRIARGLYTASLISAVLGTRLPGPGAIYIAQTLNFRAPVKIGDTVTVVVTVAELMRRLDRTELAPDRRDDIAKNLCYPPFFKTKLLDAVEIGC